MLAGMLTTPCGTTSQLRVFVPNNVETATLSFADLGTSSLSMDEQHATIALGASYARALANVEFNYLSYPTLLDIDPSKAELDGEIVRAVFTADDDNNAVAALACKLAKFYNIAEYGASLSDAMLCLRDDGQACIEDAQCSSGSKIFIIIVCYCFFFKKK